MNAALDPSALLAHLDTKDISLVARDRQERLAEILATIARRRTQRQFFDLFPDNDNVGSDGTMLYARARYAKHMEFFGAGARYRERCFLAANRVGKSTCGAYELTAHLTGIYPTWWHGRRFTRPISAWACGKTFDKVKEVNQHVLLGEVTYDTPEGKKGFPGTAMIPGHLMGRITWNRSVDDLVDSVLVKHVSGDWSRLAFKAYQQKRGAFEGTARHVIWLDEECPIEIYGECLIRTAKVSGTDGGGIIMLTFTPLDGLTETVMQFMLGMAD